MIHPKISIIMPVYNGSNFMQKAIDSALAQTYDNFEIILVNDGSDDNGKTDSIARSYGDRIVYIPRIENKGIAYTLNEGISNMSGDYFAWLSHDDMYKPDKLEKQVAFLNEIIEENEGICIDKICLCGGSETIDVNDTVIRQRKMQPRCSKIREKPELILDNLNNYGIGGCTVLIPKSAFHLVGGFNAEWRTLQDANMWFRLILEGYTFCYLNERLVQSRAHEEETGRRLKDVFETERKQFQLWLTKQMEECEDLQDWKFFLRCSYYQRRMQYKEASKESYRYAKQIGDHASVSLSGTLGMIYSSIYGEIRELARKMYWKYVVK